MDTQTRIVKIFDVDQASGEESFAGWFDVAEWFRDDDGLSDEERAAILALRHEESMHIGGGAAPLVRVARIA